MEGFHQAVDICVQQLQRLKIPIADILNSHEHSQPSYPGCCDSDNLLRDDTSDRLHSLDNLPGRQLEEMNTVNAVDDIEKSNVDDEDDGVSWYFDGLDLSDDGLEMLINAAGDMQRELGCMADVEATSLGETSGRVIHGRESGDGLAVVPIGIPFSAAVALPGGGNAVPSDMLSSRVENAGLGLEANVTRDTDTSLNNDKQAKFASIMQELARTSTLLADCNKSVSFQTDAKSSDITDGHATERSINGAISTSDAVSIVGSSDNSIVHKFDPTSHSKQSQLDCTCSSNLRSGVSGSVCTVDSVCKAIASCKCDTISRSCESHCSDTNVSHDSDEEFSSCFDDLDFLVDNSKSSRRLRHTELPHCCDYHVSARLPALDAHDETLFGKSMTLNDGFEVEQEKLNSSTSSDRTENGRQFGSSQRVRSEISAHESCLNGKAIFLKSSRHFRSTSCVALDDATLHSTPLSHSCSNPATQTDCSFDESTSCDISSKCQRENASNASRINSEGDLVRQIHKFTRCLSKGCEDIVDAVAETMLRQLNSHRSTLEDPRWK